MGLSQESLAMQAHLGVGAVGMIENQQTDVRLVTLVALVRSMGFDLAVLFEPSSL